ncbi:MAG: hypothetical protein JWQ40_1669 [Segetibacter sp.]|nr:hypothetical protein [Segetibacter sp.]
MMQSPNHIFRLCLSCIANDIITIFELNYMNLLEKLFKDFFVFLK